MKLVTKDSLLEVEDDSEVWVDASQPHRWWKRFYYWIKREKPPVKPITLTLPSGGLRAFTVKKIDSSGNPVVVVLQGEETWSIEPVSKDQISS